MVCDGKTIIADLTILTNTSTMNSIHRYLISLNKQMFLKTHELDKDDLDEQQRLARIKFNTGMSRHKL